MASAPLRAHRTDLMRIVYCLCCGRSGTSTGQEVVPRTWRWCQVGPQTGPTCATCSTRAIRRGTDDEPQAVQPRDLDPACPALEPRIPRMEIAPLPVAKPVEVVRLGSGALPAPEPTVETSSVIFPPRRITRPTARIQRQPVAPAPAPAQEHRRSDLVVWVVLALALILALAALFCR